MKKKHITKLKLNTIFGLFYQITAIICGLIVPKIVLKIYGSETNGLINSIQSFLNIITLLELGIGAVIQTALYKPLAIGDDKTVSKIICSSKRFFRIIGIIFLVFVICLILTYPFFIYGKNEIFSTMLLIIAISISMFAQYFFGMVYSLLLQADQKVYVYNIIQIFTLIFNTVLSSILMLNGLSIHVVKLVSSCIFLLRPILLWLFCKFNYNLSKEKIEGDEIPQKWNGIVQHVSAYILENTDIIILTIFSTLNSVSIYSVYYLIAHNIRLVIISMSNGITSYYGYLYAKEDYELLKNEFNKYNNYLISFSTIIFSLTLMLIVPFVMIYTKDIKDTNYNQLLFGVLLVIGQFLYCTRRSFNMLILAVGHYKQTQLSAIFEALINLIISVLFVIKFDIIGVALGTVAAMLFRTIYFAFYCSKNIIHRKLRLFFKEMIINGSIILVAIIMAVYINNNLTINQYKEWIILAIISGLIIITIFTVVHCLFDFKQFKRTVFLLVNNIKKWKE